MATTKAQGAKRKTNGHSPGALTPAHLARAAATGGEFIKARIGGVQRRFRVVESTDLKPFVGAVGIGEGKSSLLATDAGRAMVGGEVAKPAEIDLKPSTILANYEKDTLSKAGLLQFAQSIEKRLNDTLMALVDAQTQLRWKTERVREAETEIGFQRRKVAEMETALDVLCGRVQRNKHTNDQLPF